MNRASLSLSLTTFTNLTSPHPEWPWPRPWPRHLTVPIEQIISSHLFPFFIPPRTHAPVPPLVLDGECFWGSRGTSPVGLHSSRRYTEARGAHGGDGLEVHRAAFVIAFQFGREVSQSVEQTALAPTGAATCVPHRLAAPNPTIR